MPAQNPADLHHHPEVVHTRQGFEHLIAIWSAPAPEPSTSTSTSTSTSEEWWLNPDRELVGRTQVLALAHRALRALESDPTLALDPEGQRQLDLIAELTRQLKPLGRQTALARFAERLHEAPDLTEAQRKRGLNQLGKTNPAAVEEHRVLLDRAEELVAEVEARVNPAWEEIEHRRRLARTLLPTTAETTKATDQVRRLVEAALAVGPELPEAHQVLAALDQIEQLLGASTRTCAAPGCEDPLPPADPGRERRYCSAPCRSRSRRAVANR